MLFRSIFLRDIRKIEKEDNDKTLIKHIYDYNDKIMSFLKDGTIKKEDITLPNMNKLNSMIIKMKSKIGGKTKKRKNTKKSKRN